MKRLLVAAVAAWTCVFGALAYAHHSFAATYIEDKSVTIEGELVQVLFRNPHSFVHVTSPKRMAAWCGTPSSGAAPRSSAARVSPGRRSSLAIGHHQRQSQGGIPPTIGFGWSACVGRATDCRGATAPGEVVD